jgi:ketosteroid isomerase-like protein
VHTGYAGCSMKADAQTEAAVMAVLDEFNNAVVTRNLNKVLDLFTSDPDVFLLGSEAGERATGPQELESFFRRVFSREVAFSWAWKEWNFSASAKCSVAWVALDATVHMSGESEQGVTVKSAPYRITAVLERRSGQGGRGGKGGKGGRGARWLLAQYHGSEPA